jgi:hypothetical protein
MVAPKQEASWMRFGVPLAAPTEGLLNAMATGSPGAIVVADLNGLALFWSPG